MGINVNIDNVNNDLYLSVSSEKDVFFMTQISFFISIFTR